MIVEIRNPTTLRKIPGVDAAEAQGVADDVVGKNEMATKADLERMARVTIMWICSFIVGYSLVLIALTKLFSWPIK